MKILSYAMVRNEEALLPYFIRHYHALGDVTIFDDHSEDDTVSVARAEGATVLPVEGQEQDLLEHRLLRCKNHAWWPVRNDYDWVIAVDSDEFLYHENLLGALQHSQDLGATVLAPCGYQMVSMVFPTGPRPITEQIRRGTICPMYSKLCCFNPKRISGINFAVGSHYADPQGEVQLLPYPGLKLLHYHHLGLDWLDTRYTSRRRWNAEAQFLPPLGWCTHNETRERLQEILTSLNARATEVI
jgi:hypothetical protein